MNIIETKNLIKKFGKGETEITVLKGVSFSVTKGEFLAITGRSGSGKSTLLYQLGLLDHPTSGSINLGGIDTHPLSSQERTAFRLRRLGYIFQDYALIAELTAIENVAVPLLMQGLSRRDAEEQAIKTLKQVGLGDKLHNMPATLSGGQQQRVSIARALAHSPDIIFADEPTANLDSDTAESVLKVFKEINKLGQTILMVTHEPEYASLADRVITLTDGVIVSDLKTSRV